MTPNQTEKQDDPFRPIQRPLISSSNAEAHRSTFLKALPEALETCRQVDEWAAPTQERTGFDRDQFVGQLFSVLVNRQRAMRRMLDAAIEWLKQGSYGAEYASIATGLVNWEYFKWIVDFQKAPPQSARPNLHRTAGSSIWRAGGPDAAPATRSKARRNGLHACWGSPLICRIFSPDTASPGTSSPATARSGP